MLRGAFPCPTGVRGAASATALRWTLGSLNGLLAVDTGMTVTHDGVRFIAAVLVLLLRYLKCWSWTHHCLLHSSVKLAHRLTRSANVSAHCKSPRITAITRRKVRIKRMASRCVCDVRRLLRPGTTGCSPTGHSAMSRVGVAQRLLDALAAFRDQMSCSVQVSSAL
jgi:hypothetical protein